MIRFLRNVITIALANRIYILIIAFGLLVAGYVSYRNTTIIAFPDLTNTRITIITQWPGRSAQEIERFITIPIEIEMNTVPKRTQVRSISLFGLSVVYIIFEDDVEDFEGRQYVMNRLGDVHFPEGVQPSLNPPQGPVDEIFRFTLQSKQFGVREMKSVMDWVIDRQIKSIPGVADLVSFGGQVKAYEISVDPQLLARYGITIQDIFNALAKSNLNVGGDVINNSQEAFVIRGIGLLKSIESIEDIIIRPFGGNPVFIRNVGNVSETNLPQLGAVSRDSTENTVEGIVISRKGQDPGPVLSAIKDKIKDLNDNILPGDMRIIPFYDRSDLIHYTIHTVTHNLAEGIGLVCLVVFLFLGNWKATLIASITIPFSLMFAFFCLHLMGMSANLLSLGAIDFGIIADGTVVMTEGLYIILDKRAKDLGMSRFNLSTKLGLLRKEGGNLSRSVFFAALIILTALIPIFSFQNAEGKMFSPLAFTLGFALLGSIFCSLTVVPVLVSYLLDKNVNEKETALTRGLHWIFFRTLSWMDKHRTVSYTVAAATWLIALASAFTLGTEFLPHLDEGAIYVRATMPYPTSLQQSVEITQRLKKIMTSYSEVKRVLSQTGRPNDGTDATGFFNIEFHAELNPKEQWSRKITKNELVDEMKRSLEKFPGIAFNFSQPIMDNVEEAVSGVKGSLAVKIFGYDTDELEKYAEKLSSILETVPGVTDLGIIHLKGQPEIQIELDEKKMAAYGVTTADANAVIEMAIGGKTVTEKYEGERKFDVRVRYLPEYRSSIGALSELLVPTVDNNNVTKLGTIADIRRVSGNAFLYRENNKRFIAVKFSVRGRDLGGTIKEAQSKVSKAIHELPKGMSMEWKGEYENQVRAMDRLINVVPISLAIIFILLFTAFGNVRDAALIFLNVPFGLMGGILALHITGIHFGISSGIGFICLFGVSVQAGVILLSIFKRNLQQGLSLRDSVFHGTLRRVRPVFMTAMIAIFGLMPAALSSGIGSETQKPLAVVVIGGLLTDMILSVHVFPMLVEWVYRRSKNIAR